MKIKRTLLTLITTSALTTGGYSHAQWTGEAELGIADTRGNTESTIVNTKIDFDLAKDKLHHNIFGHFFYVNNDGKRAAENCDIGYKPRYFMTTRDYLFGILRYDQDEFGSIDHRTIGVGGYGRQLTSTNKVHTLDAELGLGVRQTIYFTSPSTNDLGHNEILYFLAGKYTGRISKTALFSETVRAEAGKNNSNFISITSLGLSIIGNLSAKISYTARYNTDVTGDKGKKTDTLTSVNLVYSF